MVVACNSIPNIMIVTDRVVTLSFGYTTTSYAYTILSLSTLYSVFIIWYTIYHICSTYIQIIVFDTPEFLGSHPIPCTPPNFMVCARQKVPMKCFKICHIFTLPKPTLMYFHFIIPCYTLFFPFMNSQNPKIPKIDIDNSANREKK